LRYAMRNRLHDFADMSTNSSTNSKSICYTTEVPQTVDPLRLRIAQL
jgi:hypothetical protein